MKDWTGNTKSIYSAIGASNHAVNAEREINDFYATDPQCIDDLLKYEEFNFYIWEPACGQGHLSKRLTERGFRVYSTDLIDRGFGVPGVDFLKQPATGDKQTDIITNPPYKYAREFVQKSLDIIAPGCKAAFFLKLTFLEGQTRFEKLYKTAPPAAFMFTSGGRNAQKMEILQSRNMERCLMPGLYGKKAIQANPLLNG